jgi:polyisoprenoid-binding protein YceI
VALAATLAAQDASGEPRAFAIEPETSSIVVEVRRGGVFGFLGHDHVVEARVAEGEIIADPEDLESSSVSIVVNAADLQVTDPDGPQEDVPEVQSKMQGPDVLDVESFPRIRFTSTSVAGEKTEADAWRLEIRGELELHGVTRSITLPVALRLVEHGLAAAGVVELKQSDWGIRPVSIAGVVKVKDEIQVRFELQAR